MVRPILGNDAAANRPLRYRRCAGGRCCEGGLTNPRGPAPRFVTLRLGRLRRLSIDCGRKKLRTTFAIRYHKTRTCVLIIVCANQPALTQSFDRPLSCGGRPLLRAVIPSCRTLQKQGLSRQSGQSLYALRAGIARANGPGLDFPVFSSTSQPSERLMRTGEHQ
jgi:hypothetical protein